MKNYIEHDIKVKYIDELLSKSKYWQWFIEYIEANYEFQDIDSWEDFSRTSRNMNEIYKYLVNILNHDIKELSFKECQLEELFKVAQFYQGIITIEEATLFIKSNYGKVLLLMIWVTKLINQGNATNYVIDMRIFKLDNFFKIIDVEFLKLYEEEIMIYLKDIKISGIEKIERCLTDNIREVEHPPNIDLFDKYKHKIISVDSFNYTKLETPKTISWEEQYIFNMLNVKIVGKKIQPLSVFNGISNPDISLWTKDLINNLKKYFDNYITDFVLDTIAYVLYKIEPSETVKLEYFKLMNARIIEEKEENLRCSTLEIISCLFDDKLMNLSSRKELKCFMEEVHKIEKLSNLIILNNYGIPLSKQQRKKLKIYYDEQFKLIEKVTQRDELLDYLINEDVVKSMNNDYFIKVINKFNSMVEGENKIIVASLFYSYMILLIRLKSHSIHIEKQAIQSEMIRIQYLWQNEYYSKISKSLQVIKHETEIPSKHIEDYNYVALENIIIISRYCMLTDIEDMIRVMESASKDVFIHFGTKINIDEHFPIKEQNRFNYNRHEIDDTLKDIVINIINNYGYKFLNILDVDIYVKAIHERYIQNINFHSSIFYKYKELYELIESEVKEYEILEYSDEIRIGHVTQLFPVLENKIRELGSMINIFPYKENENEFMQLKDPSSILREILLDIYNELGDYKNIPDLLFVYNFMYNSNSLNIRNECIHGRKYMNNGQLDFAFRVTLLALAMIIRRIQLIKYNISL